jgi:broad specificity phosphatase PhoE
MAKVDDKYVCVHQKCLYEQCTCNCASLTCASPSRTLLYVLACHHETGVQILTRIQSAIEAMVDMAAFETTTGSLAAVAHSSYLRLLLGSVSGFSLFSATSLQANCCINVIDFPRPAKRLRVRRPSSDQSIALSMGKVIRVNETRHLTSLPMRTSALLPA